MKDTIPARQMQIGETCKFVVKYYMNKNLRITIYDEDIGWINIESTFGRVIANIDYEVFGQKRQLLANIPQFLESL